MRELFGMFVEAMAMAIMIPAVTCVVAVSLFMIIRGV
jgi:hypothetical protein